MHKATLSFDLTDQDQKNKLTKVLKLDNYEIALFDIAQLFRAARKHGYGQEYENADSLNSLIQIYQVAEAIELLESEFYKIVNNLSVNPNQD